MALKIVWTKVAEQGFEKIIDYLQEEWTEKEVRRFIRETFAFLKYLSNHPELLQPSASKRNLRRGPINKHTIITYRVKPRKKQIELLSIRGAKQKPNL